MATKPKQPLASAPLYGRVREILEAARAGVVRTVNTTQVVANWLIGREIVEEEQQGRHRAEYGLKLVTQLSEQLTTAYGRGWSAQNLFYMKQFYLSYPSLLPASGILHAVRGEFPQAAIVHAARGESASALSNHSEIWQPGALHANLSWTH